MKKKKQFTRRRKTYKNRKRNTYKKRKNKTKRSRRRNMKGGESLRERAGTGVRNMRKRGSELWEKHGDTIKKAATFGVAAYGAHRLEKKNKTEKEHRYQKVKEEKEEVDATAAAATAATAAATTAATAATKAADAKVAAASKAATEKEVIKNRIISKCGVSPDEKCIKDTIAVISSDRRKQQEEEDDRYGWDEPIVGGQISRRSKYASNLRGNRSHYVTLQNTFKAEMGREMEKEFEIPEPAPVKTEEERGREAYAAYNAEVERSVKLHDELILLGDDALQWRAISDGVDGDKIASAHTSSGKVKRATMIDHIMRLPPSKWERLPPSKWAGAGAP
jgi:hypothetical protein